MSLPALATTAQLAAWMQVDPGALPASAATTLEIVSAIVRAEARNNFARDTITLTLWPVSTRDIPAQHYVTLPLRPVVSLASVTRDGAPVIYVRNGERVYVTGCMPVSVTFTHGYASVPGDVLAVVLTAAQRVLGNPRDLRQETVGSISVTYAAETIGASLAPADKDLLGRYRRRAGMVTTQ